VSERADGFVTFFATGQAAVGEFRCADCGYGVSIVRTLPRCPMCGGEAWEAESVRPWQAIRAGAFATASEQPVA
jgi:hypothetical protein